MLARLRILLPFKITIPEGENLQPQEYDVAPYRVVLHPPLQADIDIAAELADLTAPLLGLDRGLIPAAPPRATDAILLDGRRTIQDRKSTRLNSSHGYISYAVFCLKKKKKKKKNIIKN